MKKYIGFLIGLLIVFNLTGCSFGGDKPTDEPKEDDPIEEKEKPLEIQWIDFDADFGIIYWSKSENADHYEILVNNKKVGTINKVNLEAHYRNECFYYFVSELQGYDKGIEITINAWNGKPSEQASVKVSKTAELEVSEGIDTKTYSIDVNTMILSWQEVDDCIDYMVWYGAKVFFVKENQFQIPSDFKNQTIYVRPRIYNKGAYALNEMVRYFTIASVKDIKYNSDASLISWTDTALTYEIKIIDGQETIEEIVSKPEYTYTPKNTNFSVSVRSYKDEFPTSLPSAITTKEFQKGRAIDKISVNNSTVYWENIAEAKYAVRVYDDTKIYYSKTIDDNKLDFKDINILGHMKLAIKTVYDDKYYNFEENMFDMFYSANIMPYFTADDSLCLRYEEDVSSYQIKVIYPDGTILNKNYPCSSENNLATGISFHNEGNYSLDISKITKPIDGVYCLNSAGSDKYSNVVTKLATPKFSEMSSDGKGIKYAVLTNYSNYEIRYSFDNEEEKVINAKEGIIAIPKKFYESDGGKLLVQMRLVNNTSKKIVFLSSNSTTQSILKHEKLTIQLDNQTISWDADPLYDGDYALSNLGSEKVIGCLNSYVPDYRVGENQIVVYKKARSGFFEIDGNESNVLEITKLPSVSLTTVDKSIINWSYINLKDKYQYSVFINDQEIKITDNFLDIEAYELSDLTAISFKITSIIPDKYCLDGNTLTMKIRQLPKIESVSLSNEEKVISFDEGGILRKYTYAIYARNNLLEYQKIMEKITVENKTQVLDLAGGTYKICAWPSGFVNLGTKEIGVYCLPELEKTFIQEEISKISKDKTAYVFSLSNPRMTDFLEIKAEDTIIGKAEGNYKIFPDFSPLGAGSYEVIAYDSTALDTLDANFIFKAPQITFNQTVYKLEKPTGSVASEYTKGRFDINDPNRNVLGTLELRYYRDIGNNNATFYLKENKTEKESFITSAVGYALFKVEYGVYYYKMKITGEYFLEDSFYISSEYSNQKSINIRPYIDSASINATLNETTLSVSLGFTPIISGSDYTYYAIFYRDGTRIGSTSSSLSFDRCTIDNVSVGDKILVEMYIIGRFSTTVPIETSAFACFEFSVQ